MDFDEIQCAATACKLLKLMLSILYMIFIEGREVCLGDFIKHTSNIVLRLDTHELMFPSWYDGSFAFI